MQEYTSEIVSSVHGGAASSCATRPPHRSTTVSPATLMHTDAPTSPRAAKFSTNASTTFENSRRTAPEDLTLLYRDINQHCASLQRNGWVFDRDLRLYCDASRPHQAANPYGGVFQEGPLAKPNYKFQKRQKDLAKQKKKEEKRLKKAARTGEPPSDGDAVILEE